MKEETERVCCVCAQSLTGVYGGFLLLVDGRFREACSECYEEKTHVPGKPCCLCGCECWGCNIFGEPLCDTCAE
jgi:hypothetical protein